MSGTWKMPSCCSESKSGCQSQREDRRSGARGETVRTGTVGKARGFQAMLKDVSLQEKKEHNGNILTIWVWDFYLFTFVIKQTQASNCLQMWLFIPGCLQICYTLKRFTGLCLKITYSVIKSCLVKNGGWVCPELSLLCGDTMQFYPVFPTRVLQFSLTLAYLSRREVIWLPNAWRTERWKDLLSHSVSSDQARTWAWCGSANPHRLFKSLTSVSL